MRRLLALFRLKLDDRDVILALSCDENEVVRAKPQNLLVNLPLHEA